MKKFLQFFKRFLLVAVFTCAVAVLALFMIQWYVDGSAKRYMVSVEDAPHSEAVMVLGALVYRSGTPSLVLKDRLDYGYELYIAGKAKKILVSGDHGTKDYDEVNSMMNYLLGKGVPREDIFMDHAGFNTYDSMYRATRIFGIEKLIISTQEFHVKRAVYIARRLGMDAYGYPSDDKVIYQMRWMKLREFFAKAKAFWDTDIIRRKPKYLGDPIPIMGDGSITDG